jgi:transposase
MSSASERAVVAKRRPKAKGGRPTKLTAAVSDRICQAIRAGNYIETAAVAAGIDKATVHRWLKDGNRGKSPALKEFCASVEKALAEAEVGAVATITMAGKTQWQALAWRLERQHQTRWGRKDRIESRQVDKDGNDAPLPAVIIVPAAYQSVEDYDAAHGGTG